MGAGSLDKFQENNLNSELQNAVLATLPEVCLLMLWFRSGWDKDTWQRLQGSPNQGKNAVIILLTQLQRGEASSTNDIFIISPINAFADNKKTFYLMSFAGRKF